jgi:terminase, large subunit
MMQLHPAQEARRFLMPPSDLPTAEWGKINHELNIATSAHAGPWNLDLIPFHAGFLFYLDDDTVREVVLQKPTQEAGSETVLVWLMRVAAEDPGPAMWVFADELTAKRFCETRIKRAFRASPALAPLIIEEKFGQLEIILKNGFSLLMTWASSIAMTASVPIRYLIMDEICKPAYRLTQGEGNVVNRIRQRVQKFPNHKVVLLSSVTEEGDVMSEEMAKTHAALDYRVPCVHCGEAQPMAFREQQPDPENVRDRGDHPATEATGCVVFPDTGANQERAAAARYRCRSCGGLWTTTDKNRSVPLGSWAKRPNSAVKPRSVGLFLSRLLSLSSGGRFETLAEEFLDAKDNPENLKSLVNNAFGEHWKTYRRTSSDADLRAAILEENPPSVVPDAADCVVVTIDMQQTGFWYVARAWSARARDSWKVEQGQLLDWNEVAEMAFDHVWTKADGSALSTWRTMIDCGGGKEEGKLISRTEEAELWWIEHRRLAAGRVFLCKGSSRTLPSALSVGKILETTPSGKKIEHGGLQIVELNTARLKDLFFTALEQAKAKESRAAYLDAGTPDSYFRHITAEVKNDGGEYKKIRADNHYLDCEMMQFGAVSAELKGGLAAIGRVILARAEREKAPKTAPEQPQNDLGNPFLGRKTAAQNPFLRR